MGKHFAILLHVEAPDCNDVTQEGIMDELLTGDPEDPITLSGYDYHGIELHRVDVHGPFYDAYDIRVPELGECFSRNPSVTTET